MADRADWPVDQIAKAAWRNYETHCAFGAAARLRMVYDCIAVSRGYPSRPVPPRNKFGVAVDLSLRDLPPAARRALGFTLPIIFIDHFANRNAAAKTRFKMWWRVIGAAVEHGTRLGGHELNLQLFPDQEAD